MPVRYQAERRALAKARRATFDAPPTRRNRVWQTDFSEFETTAGGTWRITGVVDYAATLCLAVHANGTQTARDAVFVLEAAIGEASACSDTRSQTTAAIPKRASCIAS